MKQLDRLIELGIKWPLLAVGIACLCSGAVPAGVSLIGAHLVLDRLDRGESDNTQG